MLQSCPAISSVPPKTRKIVKKNRLKVNHTFNTFGEHGNILIRDETRPVANLRPSAQ